jgi:integrase
MARRRALSAREVDALMSKLGTHRVDENLFLQVRKDGTRSWAFRYSRGGKMRSLGLGAVRRVPYGDARHAATEYRLKLWRGIDPAEERMEAKAAAQSVARTDVLTFAWCADQYIEAHRAGWKNRKHIDQWESTLRMYAGPVVGKMAVDQITVDHVMKILSGGKESLWLTKPETASRLRGRIEKVLGWATAMKYRHGDNPARWQGGELPHLLPAISKVQKIEHHRSVPYAELPALMTDLCKLDSTSAKALRFTILTAARTSEVLGMTWQEVDLETAKWVIPQVRMKAGVEHQVPLSPEAVALLRSMPRDNDLVFPGPKGKQLSNMAMSMVLRGLRDDGSTVHGFRSTFSVWCRETTEANIEIVESALAHKQSDKVVAAYARTTYFDRRRDLMADWARYCMSTKAD